MVSLGRAGFEDGGVGVVVEVPFLLLLFVIIFPVLLLLLLFGVVNNNTVSSDSLIDGAVDERPVLLH